MMIKAMLLLGIGGILCLIGMWGKQSVKKGEEQKASCIRTNGVIDRVIFSDTGNVTYYVRFTDAAGERHLAQTNRYTSDTKSLNPGDAVAIGYHFTPQGVSRAVIFDERVISCTDTASVRNFPKICLVLGIVLCATALGMAVTAISL